MASMTQSMMPAKNATRPGKTNLDLDLKLTRDPPSRISADLEVHGCEHMKLCLIRSTQVYVW